MTLIARGDYMNMQGCCDVFKETRKGESPQRLCAYILTQLHLFPAMVICIMTSIAVALKRFCCFSRQYSVAPERLMNFVSVKMVNVINGTKSDKKGLKQKRKKSQLFWGKECIFRNYLCGKERM